MEGVGTRRRVGREGTEWVIRGLERAINI